MRLFALATILALALNTAQAAQAAQAAKTIRYNRDIRPILSENCFSCHGPDSASRKAGLRLDRSADATAARKDSSPAIIAGDPDHSAVLARLLTKDQDDVMPPVKTKKTLTPKQIELIRAWIAEGAEYEAHWSYQPPIKSEPPQTKQKWGASAIDQFVLARLEAEKLSPTQPADLRTLARRAALDITGLPPKPAQVEQFLKDKSPQAYEHYLDRLLESTAWGEHRARYWLDAARYADTHGIHFDNYREMWTYRQWAINAFNKNQPFDQFTLEQLAGDLLPNPTLEQLTASGFNRCNITSNEGGLIDEEYLVLYMKDRAETAAQVFMGTSAMCAACHDHKFDPISQKDYYSFAAFFNNSTAGSRDGNRKDPAPVVVIPTDADRARWTALEKETPAAKERVEARRKSGRRDFTDWLKFASAEPFAKAVPLEGLLFSAPLNGEAYLDNGYPRSITIATNALWTDGIVAEKAFQSTPDVKVNFGNIGDFEKEASWSYGAWVRIEDKDQTGGVLARMNEKDNYRGWDLFWDKDRPVAHFVNKWPDNAVRVASKTKVEPKTWNHIFVTYDGSAKPSGVRIFINGKPAETESDSKGLTETIRTTVPLTIGHRDGGGAMKNIAIQDARIYNRLLAPEDVASLARNTRAAYLAAKPSETRQEKDHDELYPAWLGTIDEPYRSEAAILAKLEKEDRDIRDRGSIAHVMKERSEEAAAFILFRGEYDRRKDRVAAATPAAFPPMASELPRNRLGLAKWLLAPNHPLTARVTVNRFWQELFGAGLVRTAGDFGIAGELPSHPELLDYLAVDFVESGWDVKRFFKNVMLSETYKQSAAVTKDKLLKDPQNRLLSRGPRFRMDAEMVRDHALAASGLLVDKIGGPSVKPYQPEGVWETVAMRESDTRNYVADHGENLYRRSLYTFWKRSAPPASMDIFNAPSREVCTVRRERTNTPLQSLVTLNDTQFIEAARALAERAIKDGGANKKTRLNYIAERLLARPLRAEELRVAESVLDDLLTEYRKDKASAELLLAIGESKPDERVNKSELAAYTMAVNSLMNLDEVLNK
jgi:mono/diheme cytochrome c family protein